jgi:hypothetical protein
MTLPGGASSFFSAPSPTLDPNLFDGARLRPDVRERLVGLLVAGLGRYLDLRGADDWVRAWLAGSGITFQWAADRGNGDLDVLFSVDMARFLHYNPGYQGIPESSIALHSDQVLKERMWPATDHTQFGARTYEATFYWAPGVHGDIRLLHPYAAYDLKQDTWVVPPPVLTDDPRSLYPGEWFDAAGQDISAAETLARRHGKLSGLLASTDPESPAGRNAVNDLAHVQFAASQLFDDIHGGRQAAFGEQGHGYGDYANFRWQHAKETGVIAGLKHILSTAKRPDMPKVISPDEILINRAGRRYGQ